MKQIHSRQQGFTLIELIVVIIILGILAATALPKFADLSTEASTAAAKGIAGGIASSAAIQYANNKATGAAYTGTAACAGDYLQSKEWGDCSAPSWDNATRVCTVACSPGTSATTTLP